MSGVDGLQTGSTLTKKASHIRGQAEEERERERERQTDRDRQTDRQTETETQRETETETQRERQRERHTQRETRGKAAVFISNRRDQSDGAQGGYFNI